MIEDLAITGDETATAVGERYDVHAVLETMGGLLDDYAAFAKAYGLDWPYTHSRFVPPRPDDDWVVKLFKRAGPSLPLPLPYGAHTMRLILAQVDEERREIDAGGSRHVVEAPPFRFELFPLAHEPLYANFGECRMPGVEADWMTCVGAPWTEYDPAPFIRIYRHLPPLPDGAPERDERDLRLASSHRRVLSGFLETQSRRGLTYRTNAIGLVEEPVTLRFPHDRYGAGRGLLRIPLLLAGGD